MNDLILFALKDEAPDLFQYANVFEIGVGKVNAAILTTHLIHLHQPSRVINFGTAGGVTFESGIHRVNKVVQHDLNLKPLGLLPGMQLHDELSVIDLSGNGIVCGTGDYFVSEKHKLRLPCDIVDMEAYSIAKSALNFGVNIEIWKYVSDQADNNSGDSWKESVAAGEPYYKQVIKKLNINLTQEK